MPPNTPPSFFTRLGSGAATLGVGLRPAARPLGLGAAFAGSALAVGFAGRQVLGSWRDVQDARTRTEEAKHPPLQVERIDPDPSTLGDELTAFFDRKTGRTSFFGGSPDGSVGPERSQEREIQTGLVVAGLVVVAVAALVVWRR